MSVEQKDPNQDLEDLKHDVPFIYFSIKYTNTCLIILILVLLIPVGLVYLLGILK